MNDAITYAVEQGWRFVKKGNGHTVAMLLCNDETEGEHNANTCMIRVFGSPRNAGNHAKAIKRSVDNCSC
ncbi:hypothetical protein [Vibrio marisflavi]|uniref:hypothetical protein n=1 Tax=Vibrio marisflavi TaxID=1216040 RepID=UPI001F4454B1|nr:hypothetical protein [Vibrio marisflavi]